MAVQHGIGGRRSSSPVPLWPLVLIVAGLLLFAANLGWLRWDSLWHTFYLWPLALVGIGVDILLRGRYRLLTIAATLLAGALLYTATAGSLGFGGPTQAAELISQPLAGVSQAKVALSTGVAQLRVSSEAAADVLVAGTVVPMRGERIEQSYDVVGGVANFSLGSAGAITWLPAGTRGRWDLTLSGRVPLELDVATGVGEAVLDLSGLELDRLDLSTGVGASTVTLPPNGGYDAAIETGVGAATLRIPEGVEARLVVSRGLGAVSVPADFVRDGDVYVSSGYRDAADRVDIRVSSGVGAVDIVRVR